MLVQRQLHLGCNLDKVEGLRRLGPARRILAIFDGRSLKDVGVKGVLHRGEAR